MRTCKLIFLVLWLIAANNLSAQEYNEDYHTSYIGIGTSFATFTGGDFGSTYQLRFFPGHYDDYYYDYGYSHNYYNYYDRDNDRFEGISPLEITLFGGHHLNEYLTIELESSFIWHPTGRPARDYVSGDSYLEFNDNPVLIAVPLLASLKLYPFNRLRSPFFITAGGGMQFTYETMDRVRSYYNYSYEYNDYNSYNEVIASYTSQHWYPGVKLALGIDTHLNDFLYASFELKYQNFFNSNSHPSPLAMIRSKYIGYIGLSTKIFVSF